MMKKFSVGLHAFSDIWRRFSATAFIATMTLGLASPTLGWQESAVKSPQQADELDTELQLATFDKVWSTIKENHWDSELVGEKWDQAKSKYRPEINKADSVNDVRRILEKMIAELGQSHFGIIPAEAYESDDDDPEGSSTAGMVCRSTADGIVVSQVYSDSPAAKAGVRTGWIVKRIRDLEMSEVAKRLKKAAKGPMRFETLVGLRLERLLRGKDGEKVSVLFEDGEGEEKELELVLEKVDGVIAKFGNLPPMQITSESRTLDGKIGYFRFNAFFAPGQVMPKFRKTIRDPQHANGVIIDLRGNIGGIGAMTMGMGNEFANKDAYLGVMRSKTGELKFALQEHYDPVACPVVVLVDECSISSAEILSGGLQDLKLAHVIGSRTAGLALPSTVIELPNGDGLQYAIADYKSASGKSLEMDGVVPDIAVELTREMLLNDSDPVLTAAIQWIQKQER